MPQVATSGTAAVAAPANLYRKSIVFRNLDSTNNIYLDTMPTAVLTTGNAGIILKPGDTIAFNSSIDGEIQLHGTWSAIASGGTPTLLWYETEDIQR